MSEPFLGEIRLVSFVFAPRGWATCAGQLLPINQNQALFSLLGTQYGGDGRVNFALPDLRGRVGIGSGRGPGLTERAVGDRGGAPTHTLVPAEMPAHRHAVKARSSAAQTTSPNGAALAAGGPFRGTPDTAMDPVALVTAGGGAAHENMQPWLALHYVIALQGVFPSPS